MKREVYVYMFGGSVSFLICGYTFNDRPLDMDRRKISREYSFDLPNLYDIFLCEVCIGTTLSL